MPVTNYYTIDGSIIAEATGGVRTDYLTDALGSVTATVDSSGNLLNTYRYKPYGEQLAKTGTAADPKFTWVGSLGYRQTGRKHSDVHVRARHYGSSAGRWTTKDPIGYADEFSLYVYVSSTPVDITDPSGRAPKLAANCKKDCPHFTRAAIGIQKFCDVFGNPKKNAAIKEKIAKCAKDTQIDIGCLSKWCTSKSVPTIECLTSAKSYGTLEACGEDYLVACPPKCKNAGKEIPYSSDCAHTICKDKVGRGSPGSPDHKQPIVICCKSLNVEYLEKECPGYIKNYPGSAGSCDDANRTLFHEIGHACGIKCNRTPHDILNVFGKCIASAIGVPV